MEDILQKIKNKCQDILSPIKLVIIDNSDQHKGHQGGMSKMHISIEILSKEFEGKSKLERHRMIYSLLQEEMSTQIHAISINARTPSEY